MKSFSRMNYRIGRAPLETKWVYTFFLAFLLIGFCTIGGYQFKQIGFNSSSVMQHYRGADEMSESGIAVAKSFSALLETTHFHAFMMGIIFLTLAHIFLATELSQRFKMSLIVLGFVSTFLNLLLPWAVRYLSGSFAHVMIVAWVVEWGAYMGMILLSLYEMWWRKVPMVD